VGEWVIRDDYAVPMIAVLKLFVAAQTTQDASISSGACRRSASNAISRWHILLSRYFSCGYAPFPKVWSPRISWAVSWLTSLAGSLD
jgi:hypothetical protein